ncbi:NRDE family protein [Ectopseudomonas guguanensis]|uniref:NRDE family protein n=1 Tax=Ectopseudomonas guguanensis TaxID=1198456 RepID=UPI003267E324
MCLIVLAWRPGHPQPLLLAANRDEFYSRPAWPLREWEDAPGLFAGRDLQAGGTWLGVTADGRFAALTNIRDPSQPPGRRSRGELPVEFLRGTLEPQAYLQRVASKAADYAGFNLLLGDSRQLWYYNSQEDQPRPLAEGLYGLSNARLDSPWPKLQRAKAALENCLDAPHSERLLALLADTTQPAEHLLPDTGVGPAVERLLATSFIASANYGTRASSALLLGADGNWEMVERSFGPHGAPLGEVAVRR